MKNISANRHHRVLSSFSDTQTKALEVEYYKAKYLPEVIKTHYIGHRFENIYINRGQIQALSELLDEAIIFASEILNTSQKIKVGFWFNEMQQGHKTSAHTHDEDDELLSAVYYINVPEHSGNLMLGSDMNERVSIKPKIGEFLFFSPMLVHFVEENKSSETRLSIGMNFGPAD